MAAQQSMMVRACASGYGLNDCPDICNERFIRTVLNNHDAIPRHEITPVSAKNPAPTYGFKSGMQTHDAAAPQPEANDGR